MDKARWKPAQSRAPSEADISFPCLSYSVNCKIGFSSLFPYRMIDKSVLEGEWSQNLKLLHIGFLVMRPKMLKVPWQGA